MRTIYKYPLTPAPIQVIDVPLGARLLAAAIQPVAATICVWAEVEIGDDHAEKEHCTVYAVETGGEVPADAGRHLATILLDPMGSRIVHVYEGPRERVAAEAPADDGEAPAEAQAA